MPVHLVAIVAPALLKGAAAAAGKHIYDKILKHRRIHKHHRQTQQQLSSNQSHSSNHIRRDAYCDRCGKFLSDGNRYYCLQCSNFDLCEHCHDLPPMYTSIKGHTPYHRRNSVSQGEIQRCFNLINYFWMIKYDRNYNEQDTAIRYISLSLALIYYFRLSINDVNAHNSNYNIITCEKFGEILSDIISNLVKIVQE
ncbi:unnamed protein product [Rotaria sp. Silwood1]|nr:unnamed protein product [Rotaria sp. Silwood1]CAF3477024.1 unnamed protein product [Rotaria sp. Silwood1]CAF4614365.1 unnamed protein product [Rotaria sp. Silwood1]